MMEDVVRTICDAPQFSADEPTFELWLLTLSTNNIANQGHKILHGWIVEPGNNSRG